MIGLHGKVTGFATLNMAEQVAMQTVEGLLQEKFGKRCPQAVPSSGALKRCPQAVPSSGALKRCPQVVDGAGELTNIIVGGINSQLTATHWAFNFLTTPTIIIG